MSKRAIVYARVSTDEQMEHGFSIPSQIEACIAYADRNKMTVVEKITEDYSGAKLDRPGLSQARDMIAQGEVDAIVVFASDRLTRNLAHSLILRDEFYKAHIEIHYVSRGKLENNPEDRMTENIQGVFNEYWREKIREGSIRGRNQRAKTGFIIYSGIPPFGYKKVGKRSEAKYVIDDVEAHVVRQIFNLYTTGNGTGSPLSLRSLSKYLNKIGAAVPSQTKRSVHEWNPFTIRTILMNEIYTGRTYYGKSRYIDEARIIQPKDKWIPIDVPELKIIDPDKFYKAKERFSRNKELSRRNGKNIYLLSGFFRCGECGGVMIAFDRTYESGNNKKYYRCGNSLAKYREAKKNGHIPTDIVAHKAENAVWNWLKELLLDPTSLEKGLHEMIESRAEKVDPKQKQLESIARLMEEEEQKIKRLVTEMGKYDDNFVLVTFRNEIEQATKNYNSLKKEYESISNELHQIELTNEQQDYIMNFAEKIKSRLELANDVEKRAILDILNVKVLLHHDNVGRWLEISCAIPAYNDAIAFNPQEALFP